MVSWSDGFAGMGDEEIFCMGWISSDWQSCQYYIPSLKLVWHLKMDGWNMTFLLGLGWPTFRGYVNFAECNIAQTGRHVIPRTMPKVTAGVVNGWRFSLVLVKVNGGLLLMVQKSGLQQLRLVVCPIFCRVLAPSLVVFSPDFWTINRWILLDTLDSEILYHFRYGNISWFLESFVIARVLNQP